MDTLENVAIGLLAVVIIGCTYLAGIRHEQSAEAARAIHVAVDSEKVLVKVEKVEDTVFVHDTVRLSKLVTQVFHDTVNVHDTVQVKQYITLTDSTIKACSIVVTECDVRHANDTAQIVQLNKIITEQKKEQPSVLAKIGTTVLHVLVGAAGGYIVGHSVK